jgi:hypothetical protein
MTKNKNSRFKMWLAVISASILFGGNALADDSLQGGWALTSITNAEGVVDEEPLPGVVVFTATHYSIMYTVGDKPRALLGEIPEGESATDAQLVEAYESLIANSGRYDIEDGNIITRAYVAKSPDYMAGWPDNAQSYGYSVDGDTLVLTTDEGPGGGGSRTFRRVENLEGPETSD